MILEGINDEISQQENGAPRFAKVPLPFIFTIIFLPLLIVLFFFCCGCRLRGCNHSSTRFSLRLILPLPWSPPRLLPSQLLLLEHRGCGCCQFNRHPPRSLASSHGRRWPCKNVCLAGHWEGGEDLDFLNRGGGQQDRVGDGGDNIQGFGRPGFIFDKFRDKAGDLVRCLRASGSTECV